MPTVEIATDAAYRAEGDRFIEICPACRLDRAPTIPLCICGHTFARDRSALLTFLRPRWTPATIAVRFPPRCPCCGNAPTRTIRLDRTAGTRGFFGPYRVEGRDVVVPVCDRVRSAWIPRFLPAPALYAGGFVAIPIGLITVTAAPLFGLPMLAGGGAALLAAFRVGGPRRIIDFTFDDRTYRFSCARADYAHELATLNRGRVV